MIFFSLFTPPGRRPVSPRCIGHGIRDRGQPFLFFGSPQVFSLRSGLSPGTSPTRICSYLNPALKWPLSFLPFIYPSPFFPPVFRTFFISSDSPPFLLTAVPILSGDWLLLFPV